MSRCDTSTGKTGYTRLAEESHHKDRVEKGTIYLSDHVLLGCQLNSPKRSFAG